MHDVLYHQLWDYLVLIACIAGLVLAAWFAISYQAQSRGAWRDTAVGRFLMTRKILLAVLFATILSYRLFGDWPGRRPIVALMLVAFAFQTYLPQKMLMEAQRARRAERRETAQ